MSELDLKYSLHQTGITLEASNFLGGDTTLTKLAFLFYVPLAICSAWYMCNAGVVASYRIISLQQAAAAARRRRRCTEGVKPAPAAEARRGPEASAPRAARRRVRLHMDRMPWISVNIMEHNSSRLLHL
jgi:hypothetical protein